MPWWYLLPALSRIWRGVEWWMFFLPFVLLFTFFMVRLNYPELGMTGVPRILRDAAPITELDAFMQETCIGYTVQRTKTLERDPGKRNWLLTSYEVKSFDGTQTWTYAWGWLVPYESQFRPSRDELKAMIPYCYFFPSTDAAKLVNDKLTEYLEGKGFVFFGPGYKGSKYSY
jgi:hypothetical protein